MARVAKGLHSTTVVVADDGSSPVGTNEWNAAPLDTGMEGNTESTKTLATGKITPTDTVTIVAAESGTTDDFDLITYSETNANDRIWFYADAGDTITVKHNQSPGAGEAALLTASAGDITLSETVPVIFVRRGTTFYQVNEVTVGAGDALVGNPLSQFAATTSAQLAGVLSDETGSGSAVFATSPTLVTPALGTPDSGELTSCTGLPLTTGVTGTLPVSNGGTGVTSKTGTGNVVLSTSPTLVTPALGTPDSGELTNCTSIPVAQATGILPDTSMPNITGDVTTSEGAVASTLSSTLNVIGTQQQWLPAGAWGTVTTNGAEFAELELENYDIMLQTFNFDTTTSEKIQFWWHPPSNWDAGTITFQPYWTAASGSGTVIFSLAGQSFADSDAIDQALGTLQTSTDTFLTANDMHIGPESSAITIADATKNEPVILQLSRDISDTLGVDAKLVGIKIIYTIDTATSS